MGEWAMARRAGRYFKTEYNSCLSSCHGTRLYSFRMRTSAIFKMALIGLVSSAMQNANAGSAVAVGSNGHLVYSYGSSRSAREARQRAGAICLRQGGLEPKILASTDVVGHGAIAVGRKGNLWIYGVSLGRPSAVDAENRAMEPAGGLGVLIQRSNGVSGGESLAGDVQKWECLCGNDGRSLANRCDSGQRKSDCWDTKTRICIELYL
jgi:hypothetical protein